MSAALLTLAAARRRGKALTSLGVSALLVGAAGWAGIEVGGRYINDALNRTTGDIRRIADVMVGQAEAGLRQWLNLTLAAGAGWWYSACSSRVLGSLVRSSLSSGQLSGNCGQYRAWSAAAIRCRVRR